MRSFILTTTICIDQTLRKVEEALLFCEKYFIIYYIHRFDRPLFPKVYGSIYIMNDQDKILSGGVYRSPQFSIENSELLLDLLQKTKDTSFSNILIMGDCNLPEIISDLWTTVRSENPISYKFPE